MTLQLIVFIVLALFIAVCSVLAVTTSRILRAATYLLFVLFGTGRTDPTMARQAFTSSSIIRFWEPSNC